MLQGSGSAVRQLGRGLLSDVGPGSALPIGELASVVSTEPLVAGGQRCSRSSPEAMSSTSTMLPIVTMRPGRLIRDRRRVPEQLESLDPRGDDGFLLLDLEVVIVLADVAECAGVS